MPPPQAAAPTLGELLGPRIARPGEFYGPIPEAVPAAFAAAASAARVPLSVAASTVLERALVRADLAALDALDTECDLTRVAEATTVTRSVRAPTADYARALLGLLHGQGGAGNDEGLVVVPVRLLDRLAAATATIRFDAQGLLPALRWELAATVGGKTMTEWALTVVLQSYRSPKARQSDAASMTAL